MTKVATRNREELNISFELLPGPRGIDNNYYNLFNIMEITIIIAQITWVVLKSK